jgi:hypothetical protein
LYPYREDPHSLRLGEPVYRPFVPIALANGDQSTVDLARVTTGHRRDFLLDSGAISALANR